MNNIYEHMQKLAFGKIVKSDEQSLNESDLRAKIKELVHSSLGEAKKKKKKEADVAPQDDTIDMDLDMDIDSIEDSSSDTISPETPTNIDIDPKIKSVQDYLQKAYANAKELGDEKLMTQIGNTITMVVRNQVLGGQVAENSKQYYKDAEADDAEHIESLEKDMKDDKKLSEEQNPIVVSQYIKQLEDFKYNNTDDLEDLINLEHAINVFHKRLLNEIDSLKGDINENESLNKTYSDDEVSNDILNKGIGNKDRGVVFFEAWHLGMHSGLEDEKAWNIYTNRNVNID